MTSRRPLVLVTPDLEDRQGRRGPYRSFVLDESYARAVYGAGGVPLVAPYSDDEDVLARLLDGVDGLLLTGGDFDVDPALFGAPPHEKLGTLKPERTRFEGALLDGAVARGLPVLGICGGMQLMNVARGGTLWQDLASERPSDVEHQQVEPKHVAGHTAVVVAGTKLAAALGTAGSVGVNTTHHQAVREVGEGLVASATAPDGLVEAIEDPRARFHVGVQWHPEAMPDDERQRGLYAAFLEAIRER